MIKTRTRIAFLGLVVGLLAPLSAEDLPPEKVKTWKDHQSGSQKLAIEQDELSADVQVLIDLQSNEEVVRLLEAVEEIMAEVTGRLDEQETGGVTIAAETEIIETIFEAARKRAQQSGGT